ncbi:type I-E CRISPR-associated protein Cas6/Cse3/CasE [Corynebacterium ulceribovis]|uniref:type I-E CRISPR-associated protein Cas6/Cse3/CasE n=1 Tax=Corynebacterium ulceribovis TaxID=487732 RepID=UPI00037CDFEB|nr:type I-E CRISPR-associated protein Cas6/Cse3/CasE [Corynebacterium ulceribovis]
MHITTIRLHRGAARQFRDAHHAHAIIYTFLGERGLWAQPQPDTIVIQHGRPIDWLAHDDLIKSSFTTEIPQHADGDEITFALIGNPTFQKFERGKRGKRKPLPPERWNEWLERRMGEILDLHTIDTTSMSTATGRYHARRTTHLRVMYLGMATVKDAARLHTLKANGVGRGKAYGCGLLITQKEET